MGSAVSYGFVRNEKKKRIVIIERLSIEGDRIRNGEDSQ